MSLFIYHFDTRTIVPTNDNVFLCDTNDIEYRVLQAMHTGIGIPEHLHKGLRLDTYNLTNAFLTRHKY